MRQILIVSVLAVVGCSRQPPEGTTTVQTTTSQTTTSNTTTSTITTTTTADDATLYDIQQGVYAQDTEVTAKNVTVVGTSSYGFYLVEPEGGAWGGVYAYYGPDWQSIVAGDLKSGDVVDITGTVKEYNDVTEIDFYGGSVTIIGNTSLPEAVVVETSTLADTKAAEAYESVLVKVINATVTDENPDGPKNDYGEFAIDDGVRINDLWYDVEADVGAVVVGDNFSSIAGLLRYEYGNFHITPVTADDVGTFTSSGDTGTTETGDTGTISKPATIYDVQMGVYSEGDSVVVEGVVTGETPYGFYLQDASGGEYSGVYAYHGSLDWASKTVLDLGDTVELSGVVQEYNGLTELSWNTGDVTVLSSGSVPLAASVTTAILANAKTAEPYEGVLVKVENATITDINPDASKGADYGEFSIDDGVRVDDLIYDVEADIGTLDIGDSWTEITGVLNYTFSHYKLEPRSAADFSGYADK